MDQPSPTIDRTRDYFARMGWHLSEVPDQDGCAWHVCDPAGETLLGQHGPLCTIEAIWARWMLVARRRAAEEAAADLVLDAVDCGFLQPFSCLEMLRAQVDPTDVIGRASKVAYAIGGAPLPADWKRRIARVVRGRTLAALDTETWLDLAVSRSAQRTRRQRKARAGLSAKIPAANTASKPKRL